MTLDPSVNHETKAEKHDSARVWISDLLHLKYFVGFTVRVELDL